MDDFYIKILLVSLLETFILFILVLFSKLRVINQKWQNHMAAFLSGLYNSRLNPMENLFFSSLGESINKLLEAFQDLHTKQIDFQQNRKNFLTEITHDIRTPLTSIIGYTQAMQDDLNLSEEEKKQYLDIVNQKARDLKEHMEQLFLLARCDSQEIIFQKERMNLAEVLRSSLLSFYPRFKARNQEPQLSIPQGPVFILADEISISRIINNIMENHLRYSPQNQLGIQLYSTDDEANLKITTHNKKLPDKLIYQLNLKHRQQITLLGPLGRGTGLGLPIAKALTEANSGRLQIENHEDSFSFTLLFPIVR